MIFYNIMLESHTTPTEKTQKYPEIYDDQEPSKITEYDFWEASQAWRKNKKYIGSGMFVYRKNLPIWYIDQDD